MNNASRIQFRRSGTTLLEVLATMSILLLIAMAAVAMLGKVTKIGLESKIAHQARADIARLARQFRQDVHQSDQTVLSNNAQSLDLIIGEQTVRYQFDTDAMGVSRKQINNGEQASIEWFGLTPRCRPDFDVQDKQIIMRLTAADARNPWLIEALRQ